MEGKDRTEKYKKINEEISSNNLSKDRVRELIEVVQQQLDYDDTASDYCQWSLSLAEKYKESLRMMDKLFEYSERLEKI